MAQELPLDPRSLAGALALAAVQLTYMGMQQIRESRIGAPVQEARDTLEWAVGEALSEPISVGSFNTAISFFELGTGGSLWARGAIRISAPLTTLKRAARLSWPSACAPSSKLGTSKPISLPPAPCQSTAPRVSEGQKSASMLWARQRVPER